MEETNKNLNEDKAWPMVPSWTPQGPNNFSPRRKSDHKKAWSTSQGSSGPARNRQDQPRGSATTMARNAGPGDAKTSKNNNDSVVRED